MTTAYYNEFEPFAADWLGNMARKGLIADGTIDRRSIADVSADDVSGFRRVHFFAGIGGWDYALQLAGWPADREVWTGSCPCQPYSSAGKQLGNADARNLWPEMFRLVAACRPVVVFGEQVPGAIGHGWLDGVFADLESEGYSCGAVVLGAHSVGAPHRRQRLYWVADLHQDGRQSASGGHGPEKRDAESRGHAGRLGDPDGGGQGAIGGVQRGAGAIAARSPGAVRLEHAPSNGRLARRPESVGRSITSGCGVGRLGDAGTPRLPIPEPAELPGPRRRQEGRATEQPGRTPDPWADFRLVPCTDGKTRRVGAGVQPLAHGIPRDMGRGQPELRRLANRASGNRVGRLRGYGNAIVPQVAAVFIRAFMEATS